MPVQLAKSNNEQTPKKEHWDVKVLVLASSFNSKKLWSKALHLIYFKLYSCEVSFSIELLMRYDRFFER